MINEKDQRVSHKVALKAKQKGFPQDYGYGYSSDKECELSLVRGTPHIYAPTQSELYKWLRDKHNLYILIEPTSLGDNAPFIKEAWGEVLHDPWVEGGIDYTYEGAMEYALFISMSFIKEKVND